MESLISLWRQPAFFISYVRNLEWLCFWHSVNCLNKIGWSQPWMEQGKYNEQQIHKEKCCCRSSEIPFISSILLPTMQVPILWGCDSCSNVLSCPPLLSEWQVCCHLFSLIWAWWWLKGVRIITGEAEVRVFMSWGNLASNFPSEWHISCSNRIPLWSPLDTTFPTCCVRHIHTTMLESCHLS